MGTGATAKGYPYPVPADNNDVPTDIQALAQKNDDRPGVSPLTTAQRDALAGVELWAGRVIWNTTTTQLERYSGGAWGAAVAGVTFGGTGDMSASAVADTASAGASGKVSDAGHRHAREGFGGVTAETSYGLAAANGSATTEARSDHTHGTPATPVTSLAVAGVGLSLNASTGAVTITGSKAAETIVTSGGAYAVAAGVTVVLQSGTFTVTLPAAASNSGRVINVKNTGTGTVTVATSGGNIDGAATAVIAKQYNAITVVSDGANWFII